MNFAYPESRLYRLLISGLLVWVAMNLVGHFVVEAVCAPAWETAVSCSLDNSLSTKMADLVDSTFHIAFSLPLWVSICLSLALAFTLLHTILIRYSINSPPLSPPPNHSI